MPQDALFYQNIDGLQFCRRETGHDLKLIA